jgi:hypothetical protein
MHNKIRNLAQAFRAVIEDTQGDMSREALIVRHFARSGESVNGGKGDFLLGLVLPGRLSESLGRLFDIEDIVNDLERQSNVFSIA